VFRKRFCEVRSDQYHFTRLQTARQAKNDGLLEFADRCKGLAQKVMSKVNEPRAQQIHRENADRMCLASFVAGLSGVVGRQLRYAHSRTLQEAFNLVLAVDKAERQERRNETFYTRSGEFAGELPRSASKKSCERNDSARSADSGSSSQQNMGLFPPLFLDECTAPVCILHLLYCPLRISLGLLLPLANVAC